MPRLSGVVFDYAIPRELMGETERRAFDALAYGPLPPDQAITVRVALKLRNQAALNAWIRNINDPANALYGQSLTPAQFAATYAPGNADVQRVIGYLESFGFENVTAEPNNLLVSADGTAGQASAAFNTLSNSSRSSATSLLATPRRRKSPPRSAGSLAPSWVSTRLAR